MLYELRDDQRSVIEDLSPNKVVSAPRQWGKTVLALKIAKKKLDAGVATIYVTDTFRRSNEALGRMYLDEMMDGSMDKLIKNHQTILHKNKTPLYFMGEQHTSLRLISSTVIHIIVDDAEVTGRMFGEVLFDNFPNATFTVIGTPMLPIVKPRDAHWFRDLYWRTLGGAEEGWANFTFTAKGNDRLGSQMRHDVFRTAVQGEWIDLEQKET